MFSLTDANSKHKKSSQKHLSKSSCLAVKMDKIILFYEFDGQSDQAHRRPAAVW